MVSAGLPEGDDAKLVLAAFVSAHSLTVKFLAIEVASSSPLFASDKDPRGVIADLRDQCHQMLDADRRVQSWFPQSLELARRMLRRLDHPDFRSITDWMDVPGALSLTRDLRLVAESAGKEVCHLTSHLYIPMMKEQRAKRLADASEREVAPPVVAETEQVLIVKVVRRDLIHLGLGAAKGEIAGPSGVIYFLAILLRHALASERRSNWIASDGLLQIAMLVAGRLGRALARRRKPLRDQVRASTATKAEAIYRSFRRWSLDDLPGLVEVSKENTRFMFGGPIKLILPHGNPEDIEDVARNWLAEAIPGAL